MAQTQEDIDLTTLVAKELLGKAIFAHVVPQKGVDPDHFAVDFVARRHQVVGLSEVSVEDRQ